MPDVSIEGGPVRDTGTGEYQRPNAGEPVTVTAESGYPPTGAAGKDHVSGQGHSEAFEHLGPTGDYVGPDNRTSTQWPAVAPDEDEKPKKKKVATKAVTADEAGVENKSISSADFT